MAQSAQSDEILWFSPQQRGVIPIGGFHVSRSLKRRIRKGGFDIRLDGDFEGVIDACADRKETWINAEIRALYRELFEMGHAHSIEIIDKTGAIGGVYGVSIGAAFFGESMFSRATDGSKLALKFLLDHLKARGFLLFDTQYLTDHLASLGGIEISRGDYLEQLSRAIRTKADF